MLAAIEPLHGGGQSKVGHASHTMYGATCAAHTDVFGWMKMNALTVATGLGLSRRCRGMAHLGVLAVWTGYVSTLGADRHHLHAARRRLKPRGGFES